MRILAEILVVAFLVAPRLAWSAPDDRFDGAAKTASFAPIDIPAATVAPSAADPRLWVVLIAPDRESRTAAAEAGMAIEQVQGDMIAGTALPETLRELASHGFEIISAEPLLERFSAKDFPKEDAIYHNYAETAAALRALAAEAPDLVSVFSAGKSYMGRDILCVRFNSSAKKDEPSAKPGIVFMGNHHAREHLSNEIPLLLAEHLVKNRRDPEIAKLLASRDIYFIPMVNPDGAEYDTSGDRYHMHRKNMRENSDRSVGVDLNRNYGYQWGGGGASTNPRSDTYRGEAAFSEPESTAIKEFVEARPNLSILLTYHTFSELILYPWGHKYDPIEDAKALNAYKAMANAMAAMTGYTPQQSSDLYIASGDTTDWSWGALGIFSFTFELSPKSLWGGGFYPGPAAVATTFSVNVRPALYLIDLADDPYRASSASSPVAGPSRPVHISAGR